MENICKGIGRHSDENTFIIIVNLFLSILLILWLSLYIISDNKEGNNLINQAIVVMFIQLEPHRSPPMPIYFLYSNTIVLCMLNSNLFSSILLLFSYISSSWYNLTIEMFYNISYNILKYYNLKYNNLLYLYLNM